MTESIDPRLAGIQREREEQKKKDVSRFYYVDIDKLNRLGIKQFKARVGDNFIAVIPPSDSPEMYFARKVWVHGNIGPDRLTFLCLRKTPDIITNVPLNEKCACCERCDVIAAQDAKDDRLVNLSASKRYLYWIVDLADLPQNPTTGMMEKANLPLMWWDAAPGVNDEISGLCQLRRGGGLINISHPDKGRIIVFTRTGQKTMTRYTRFGIEDRGALPKSWLNVPKFEDILRIGTYEDMQEALVGVDSKQVDDDLDIGDSETVPTRVSRQRTDVVDEHSAPKREAIPTQSAAVANTVKEEPKAVPVEAKPVEAAKPVEEKKANPTPSIPEENDLASRASSIRDKIRAKSQGKA